MQDTILHSNINPLGIFWNVICVRVNGILVRLLFEAGYFVMRPLCRTNDQTMALLRGFSRAGIHRLLDTWLLQDHVFSSLHHLTGIHEYLFEYQYLSDLCVIILIHHPSSSMLKINVPFSFNVGTFRAGELVFLTALNPSSVFLHTPVQPNPTRA